MRGKGRNGAHIFELQIAVHDAVVVAVRSTRKNLCEEPPRQIRRQSSFVRHFGKQLAAACQFHNQVDRGIIDINDLQQADHVLVPKLHHDTALVVSTD